MRTGMNNPLYSTLLLAAALYDVAFAIFHMGFWRLLRWPASLAPAGRMNSAVTQTLNIVMSYVFLAAAAGMIFLWSRRHEATLLLLAGAGFWMLRAALEPVLFDQKSKLSRVMMAIFVAGVLLHSAPVVLSL
jgi:hypothetical protein